MSEQNHGAPAPTTTTTPIAPVTPPVVAPAAPAPGEEWKAMSTEQFNERLAKERAASEKALLKAIGVEKADDAKAALSKLKEREQAEMTESQRLKAQLAEIEGKAKRAEVYEGTLKRYLESEEKAVPEAKRGLLDLAPPAEQVEARLDWIAKAKAAGLFAVAAPAAPVEPPRPANPATTMATPGPTPPRPAGTQSAFEQYESLRKAGKTIQAEQYYQLNRSKIEASRPSQ